ncbi:MAG: hypothetical protein PWP52_728 [Bacteroidales bacterium]|nr:hypothetical protein [Bacteroidales bacterium]
MKNTIILFFITTLITLSCCQNKGSKDLNYLHLNQIAKNINADLEHISIDMNDLPLILKYNISFDKHIKWDNTAYFKKNNQHYFTPYQKVNQKPFIEGQSYWIETPYADPYGRGWIISCIEPVYYHDEFIGILSADIPVKNILMYNSPPLAKHKDKGMREAIHKILKSSLKENFYIERKNIRFTKRRLRKQIGYC